MISCLMDAHDFIASMFGYGTPTYEGEFFGTSGELGTIDLHHGSYSSDPPYSRLEVIGVPVSEKIKLAMAEYGFAEFRANSSSFEAIRQA